MPFGEFQPLGDLLRPISNFFNIPGSSLSQGSYHQDKSDWSGLVCWEIVFNNTFVRYNKILIVKIFRLWQFHLLMHSI